MQIYPARYPTAKGLFDALAAEARENGEEDD
jgi:hypothetical protein